MKNRSAYTRNFHEIGKTRIAIAGGKGANLGELSQITGINVPDGFCISTEAFKKIIGETPSIGELLDRLSFLKMEDRDKIAELSGEIRRAIEGTAIHRDIIEEIVDQLKKFGEKDAYAVRSSATAEDLPAISFAGQHDTYLNIIGEEAILPHIGKCWASLFTERAIIYRLQNGFDHRKVSLAVVVQKMVFPQAAGILFTADPVNGNRKVVSIDASFGLGEAMVSGRVNTDNYKVRDGRVIDKKISAKKLAIYAEKNGGTREREIEPERQNRQALTDEQILELERIGRKVEEHFAGHLAGPQDIEWCLVDEKFYIVQSRPITTLYPVPETSDRENHVYISVGHQQMMTDAMRPLGLSMWRITPMFKAGGRLFVDVTRQLSSPGSREMLLNIARYDPLLKDALEIIVERDFIKLSPDDRKDPVLAKFAVEEGVIDPAIVSDLIGNFQTSLEELKENIKTRSGAELFDLILEDIGRLRQSLTDPRNMQLIMAAINAASWINEKMNEWLGEKNAADTLSRSVPNNITSEMGLALLDVADAIRGFPEVIEYLRRVKDDNFLDELDKIDGGRETRDAVRGFLDKYGMRGPGEIDITRTRWSEKPSILIPIILGNIRNFEPGESRRKFEQGRQEALKKERDLLDRLKQLPNGEQKAQRVDQTKQKIDLIRNFAGYREYPKYSIINRYFVYKQALLKEAEKLVQAGVLNEKEDIYYLTFEEFREAVRTKNQDRQIIAKRKDEYRSYEKMTPPRVITSEGEIVAGKYKRQDFPAGAIVGLAVSAGVIEGRARVILNMEDAALEDGDILVTVFTDPSWTPLFVAIKGLVTEVGGLMTHGAVIAREYGLPAVVGVENATKLIKDGQRIRLHGTEGYIEILN